MTDKNSLPIKRQEQSKNDNRGGSTFRSRRGRDGENRDDKKDGFKGRRDRRPKEKPEFESKMLDLARVTRVTKGGKRFNFRATVVIGDGKGMTGVGVAQGKDVQQAMQKATSKARKSSIKFPIVNSTIPHQIEHRYHAVRLLLKPASKGSGVKAGGAVRVVARLSGIENITAKLLERTNNKTNIARATIEALALLKLKPDNKRNKLESINTNSETRNERQILDN